MSACDIFLELFSNSCVESVCIDKVDVDMCVYGGGEGLMNGFCQLLNDIHVQSINHMLQSCLIIPSLSFEKKNSLKLHSVDKGPSDHLTKYF